jgi:hypothetical protein
VGQVALLVVSGEVEAGVAAACAGAGVLVLAAVGFEKAEAVAALAAATLAADARSNSDEKVANRGIRFG